MRQKKAPSVKTLRSTLVVRGRSNRATFVHFYTCIHTRSSIRIRRLRPTWAASQTAEPVILRSSATQKASVLVRVGRRWKRKMNAKLYAKTVRASRRVDDAMKGGIDRRIQAPCSVPGRRQYRACYFIISPFRWMFRQTRAVITCLCYLRLTLCPLSYAHINSSDNHLRFTNLAYAYTEAQGMLLSISLRGFLKGLLSVQLFQFSLLPKLELILKPTL